MPRSGLFLTSVLALGWAALAPGATLTWPRVDWPVVVAVERGQLALTAPAPGTAVVRADGSSWHTNEALLQRGDSARVGEQGVITWRATGDAPAVVLVLTLGPAEAGADATPLAPWQSRP